MKGTLTDGMGGKIAAWIAENCFSYLDMSVMSCASLDTAVLFIIEPEKNVVIYNRLNE